MSLCAKATTLVESILPNLCLKSDRTIGGVDEQVLFFRPREASCRKKSFPCLPCEPVRTRHMGLCRDEFLLWRLAKDRWSNSALKESKSVSLPDLTISYRSLAKRPDEAR